MNSERYDKLHCGVNVRKSLFFGWWLLALSCPADLHFVPFSSSLFKGKVGKPNTRHIESSQQATLWKVVKIRTLNGCKLMHIWRGKNGREYERMFFFFFIRVWPLHKIFRWWLLTTLTSQDLLSFLNLRTPIQTNIKSLSRRCPETLRTITYQRK